MCKFVKELVVRDFGEKLDINTRGLGEFKYRQFEPLRLQSNLWLSIQASYAHYSKPRETFEDLEAYTHWEMAMFTKDDFVSVDFALPDFESIAELNCYFDGSVYSYVPKDLIEELYLALK